MPKTIKMPKPAGLPEDLRRSIKAERLKRGWGQRKLASMVGLPQPHVSAIESGDVVPRYDTLIEILRNLGLDLLVVPRTLVPAVQSLVRAAENPDGEERPLYAVNEDDLEAGGDRQGCSRPGIPL